jgi:hypothetical protein
MYWTSPKNCRTCLANLGAGQLRIHKTFVWSASIPYAEMWCPKKSISVVNNMDFFNEQSSCAFHNTSRTRAMFCLCSSSVLDQMIMSSKYM